MDSSEVKKLLQLTYNNLVEYLLLKYRSVQYDYFCKESCASSNAKAKRTSEGLFIHHIDEDKAIMLSDKNWAIKNPFAYQKADRLVYCNLLEHLILHIKIVEEPQNVNANKNETPGLGGVINYLCPEINYYYEGRSVESWYMPACEVIEDNFYDYINVLKYFICIVEKKKLNKKRLSGQINNISISRQKGNVLSSRVYSEIEKYVAEYSNWEFEIMTSKELFFKNLHLAERGHSIAQRYVANCYFYGNGVQENDDKAVEWYKKAAVQDDAKSQNFLLKHVEILKYKYDKKLAELNGAKACFNLGVIYEFGNGVEKNFNNAFECYLAAAKLGHARSQVVLGNWYLHGMGIYVNHEKALYWFTLAANQGIDINEPFVNKNPTVKNS